ncbi:unnamed protein product [Brugia timori]|uniref:Uncharacterized protein n=1 Tax=Brugia timori TaxID=42155 RepID=A0A0R3QEI3_9BILA|nr:unnamed protein product [Brugia timori]
MHKIASPSWIPKCASSVEFLKSFILLTDLLYEKPVLT